jgi:hypothetical protein
MVRATPGGPGGTRVTRANVKKIEDALFGGNPMTRAQVIELLGQPSLNLGSRPLAGGAGQSQESLEWRDRASSTIIDFVNGKVAAMMSKNP